MNKNIAILFLVASVAAVSCSNSTPPAAPVPPPANVATYIVSEETVVGTDSYPASVVPLNEVELRAEVGGYLTGVYVTDGQKVSKGQKLYEVDRTRYLAAVQSASSAVRIAQANLDKVNKDLERYTRLAQQDAIARQRVDYAQTDVNNAQAQLEAAKSTLNNTRNDLGHAVITAPFSGTIGIAAVKRGSLVAAGSTLINTLSSEDPIAVDFSINAADIGRFNALQRSVAAESVFSVAVAGQDTLRLPGKIVAIDRAVNEQTGTITVRVSFPNAGGRLRAGMTCTLLVRNSDDGKKLTIPTKALTEQMSEFFVFIVGDSSKVSQRKVDVGARFGDKAVIRNGLKAGDTIVSDGVQNLREGAVVNANKP
ncbi:efflux RND transporter periplasmic adaptor subunit [Hufsiella ginkgonis]|uniref:Efflux RND transporter periplasmic adaptor subunit n=1 Tax=Hufsiella ginkgonis TaxID=2695274 RepID=A0A7K1XZI1_9SPHI|nr:efflux RND transporter periplasmic adaptor subunit [Hufsiella ginkgonis]MXV16424.1 efflux RND transporter periplasmic adaptor subunit [Hufsiella ginkgonis]